MREGGREGWGLGTGFVEKRKGGRDGQNSDRNSGRDRDRDSDRDRDPDQEWGTVVQRTYLTLR